MAMDEKDFAMESEEVDDDALEIIEEVADELGVELDSVLFPPHKLDVLWEDLSEDQFREHMKTTLEMLK